MRNLLEGMMADARTLLLGLLLLMAIWFVIQTWNRTRSAVSAIGAALIGVVVLTLVIRYGVIKDEVKRDIDRYRTTDNGPLVDDD
jgi:hypothetical protein